MQVASIFQISIVLFLFIHLRSERLSQLGTGVPESNAEKQHVMWTLITAFCDMFNNTIRGKYDRKLQAYYR